MQTSRSVDNLFLISVIGGELFAVPVNFVREIVTMPKISPVPESETYMRGVVNLRDSIIPVIDMRLRLGMISCIDETEAYIQMMHDRESDHRNWLQELEQSVKEKRPFKLATDPHQCAFGKWYYAYDAKSSVNQCIYLNMIMPKFEGPHDRIHEIAKKVAEMQNSNNFDGAIALIEKTRNTELARMIHLFDEARAIIRDRKRELAIVVEIKGTKVAMAVDAVESIEHLNQEIDEKMSMPQVGLHDGIIEKISQRTKDDKMVVVLNPENLGKIDEFHMHDCQRF
jgi:chemotaxis signal transduction protein